MSIDSIGKAEEILSKHFSAQREVAEKSNIENDIKWVTMKFSHSKDVLRIAEFLIENDSKLNVLDDGYKLYGKIAALLHDVGRFYEIGENRKGFTHGIFGVENILRNLENENNPFILLPIKYHDNIICNQKVSEELANLSLSDHEKNIILILADLVRDSDKVANFEFFNIIDERGYFLSKKREVYFSEKCLNSFRNRNLVLHADRNTIFDQLLGYITWVYDLNFQASKDFIRENNLMSGLLNITREEISNIQNASGDELNNMSNALAEIENQLRQDNFI